MLILSRKIGQKIVIGEDIEVIISDIVNGQVKVGISAPKSIAVDRDEVRQKKNADLINKSGSY